MTIGQAIELAADGELKNIAIKEDTSVILGYLNLGLIELYKRFPIFVKEVIITFGQDGTTQDPYTKISDSIYELPEDFISIVEVYEEVEDANGVTTVNIVPVNEEDTISSINMISWNQMQVPVSPAGQYMSVIYNAAPTYFTGADLNKKLPLPVWLYEALFHYIGYKGHASISALKGEQNVHYQKFEMSCQNALAFGNLTPNDLDMSFRINDRNFV